MQAAPHPILETWLAYSCRGTDPIEARINPWQPWLAFRNHTFEGVLLLVHAQCSEQLGHTATWRFELSDSCTRVFSRGYPWH